MGSPDGINSSKDGGAGSACTVSALNTCPAAHVTMIEVNNDDNVCSTTPSVNVDIVFRLLKGHPVNKGSNISLRLPTSKKCKNGDDERLMTRHFRVIQIISDPAGVPVMIDPHTKLELLPFEQPIIVCAKQTDKTVTKLAGLDDPYEELTGLLKMPLQYATVFARAGVKCPQGLLLRGPPGTGKTLLVTTVAAECGARLITIDGPELFTPFLGESEANLRQVFTKATNAAKDGPTILFIDEIDTMCPRRSTGKSHGNRMVTQLLTLMDGVTDRGRLVVVGATNRPNALDPALRRPGRFDREIEIPPPTLAQRTEILRSHTKEMPLSCNVDLGKIASCAKGYVGADLAALACEAALSAIRRTASSTTSLLLPQKDQAPIQVVTSDDFDTAMATVVPSTQRGASNEIDAVQWNEIAGLNVAVTALREMAEGAILYPEQYARLNLAPPRGILLYGPPGTGKTTLVKALATSCQYSFQSLNSAQIYSPYVGDAERTIRDTFKRARASTPALIFLDEVDTVVGNRNGADEDQSGGVQARVLSTLLNEMDGVESAQGILVIGATNRPWALDAAFLRPGRMDLQIYVGPPDASGRLDILKIKTSSIPIDSAVDLNSIARRTELYSGADLENLCREASLIALRDDIERGSVSPEHFEKALTMSSPSLKHSQLDVFYKIQGRSLTQQTPAY